MSIVTEGSSSEHKFGEIVILFEFDVRFQLMGIAMNGLKKAPRVDLINAIGFLDAVLLHNGIGHIARKMVEDAKIPLLSTLESLPEWVK